MYHIYIYQLRISSFLISDLICFLEYSNFFLRFILFDLIFFLHNLNDDASKFLLMILIMSGSLFPVKNLISSKVILSAHASHISQS